MPASPQADMTTAPIDPADDLGQQEVHTDPPADDTPSVVADAPPDVREGFRAPDRAEGAQRAVLPSPPVRAGQPKPLPGSAMVSTNVPTLGVSRSGRERKKNSKLQDDNWGISDKELWAKKEIEAIKAQRQRFATEEDTQDTEFYVVRTEDVDPGEAPGGNRERPVFGPLLRGVAPRQDAQLLPDEHVGGAHTAGERREGVSGPLGEQQIRRWVPQVRHQGRGQGKGHSTPRCVEARKRGGGSGQAR